MPERLKMFPPIRKDDIPPASVLLFYGGNWLTELVGNKIYKHPFRPPAFHAAGYIGDGEVLNIGKQATIESLESMCRSSRRIDVVILNEMSKKEREIVCRRFRRDAGKNTYDIIGYVRFGSRLKILRWLKKIRSSDRNDFCSDNVSDNLSQSPWKNENDAPQELRLTRGFPISFYPGEDTAPWHILEYAISHPDVREVRTVHVGDEFLKKFGG